jgi:hypothetical protein
MEAFASEHADEIAAARQQWIEIAQQAAELGYQGLWGSPAPEAVYSAGTDKERPHTASQVRP